MSDLAGPITLSAAKTALIMAALEVVAAELHEDPTDPLVGTRGRLVARIVRTALGPDAQVSLYKRLGDHLVALLEKDAPR
jgi:hypothetical protein